MKGQLNKTFSRNSTPIYRTSNFSLQLMRQQCFTKTPFTHKPPKMELYFKRLRKEPRAAGKFRHTNEPKFYSIKSIEIDLGESTPQNRTPLFELKKSTARPALCRSRPRWLLSPAGRVQELLSHSLCRSLCVSPTNGSKTPNAGADREQPRKLISTQNAWIQWTDSGVFVCMNLIIYEPYFE